MEHIPAEIVELIAQDIAYPKGEHVLEYGFRTLIYPNTDLK